MALAKDEGTLPQHMKIFRIAAVFLLAAVLGVMAQMENYVQGAEATDALCQRQPGDVAFQYAIHPDVLLHCGDTHMQKEDYPAARHYYERFLMVYRAKDTVRAQAKHKWFLCMDYHRDTLKERQHIPTQINFTKPDNVSAVPKEVIAEFERRHCAVAEGYLFNKQKCYSPKISSGQFARRGQQDWIALCGKGGSKTEISIVWGGTARCVPTIAPTDSMLMMERTPSGEPYFARTVGSIDPQAVATQIKKYPFDSGLSQEQIDHEAVIDSRNSAEGQRTLWYCDNEQWKQFRLDEAAAVEVFDREHN